jgi:hypothetical protein
MAGVMLVVLSAGEWGWDTYTALDLGAVCGDLLLRRHGCWWWLLIVLLGYLCRALLGRRGKKSVGVVER